MCELLADLFSVETDFEIDVIKQMKGLSMLVSDPWGRALVVVAVVDNSIVGMATVQTLVSTAEGGWVGLVEDVIVDRRFRGRGVGKLLLERITAWGRTNGLKRLQLLADSDNRRALDFYSPLRWVSTRLICLRKML
jgi:GNAT superfamily N-acetyltransferase